MKRLAIATTFGLGMLILSPLFSSDLQAQSDLRIVTDIKPIALLVEMVTDGSDRIQPLIPVSQSPHNDALRPSDARRLQRADVVVWVGPDLTPNLERRIKAIASEATSLFLMGDDHYHGHGADRQSHKDKHHHGTKDHAHDHHAWIDPVLAKEWLGEIVEVLEQAHPSAAENYRQKLSIAEAELDALAARVTEKFSGLNDRAFIADHDAYTFFSRRFGLTNAGSVSDSEDVAPSAAQLSQLRKDVRNKSIGCAVYQSGSNSKLMKTVTRGSDTRLTPVDILGRDGAESYVGLIDGLADAFAACLKG